MNPKTTPINLKKLSDEILTQRLEHLARTERKITHLILLHLNELEERNLHLQMGFDSLFSYLVKHLHYSESSAYRRLQAARLLKAMPEVASKIESGALNLSQLTQVQKCLKSEKKNGRAVATEQIAEVLTQLESKNTFESEKILAKEFNWTAKTHEVTKPQQDDSVRLEITLTREQFEVLQKAQSLLSHQCPEGAWAEVITKLAQKFNQSRLGKGPTVKTTSDLDKATTNEMATDTTPEIVLTTAQSNTATQVKIPAYRPAISVRVRRQLLEKAGHSCEYIDRRSGHRCQGHHQLEIDHQQPLALGGGHNIENLRIFCREHNRLAAKNSGLGSYSARLPAK